MEQTIEQNKISVIIPVYNTALYLRRCLDSVIQSTYRHLEIICVNDGSTDESLSILEQYRALDLRVVIVNQINSGVSAARNAGMSRATGEFISFVDSDDWVHPQMFEVLRDSMHEDVCMAVCMPKHVDHQEQLEQFESPKKISIPSLREAYKNTTIRYYVWGRLYRTSMVIGRRFDTEISLGEDTVFNLMLAGQPGKCTFIEERLYFYFQRDTSAVHAANWEKYSRMVEQYIQLAKKENAVPRELIYEDAIKKAFFYRYTYMFTDDYPKAAKAAKASVREALSEVKKQRLMSNKKIIAYTLMNDFPFLYRIYRIAGDPTLLDWEKEQKKVLRSTPCRRKKT